MESDKLLGKKRYLPKLKTPFDENENDKLIKLESIRKYKEKKIKEWEEKKNNKDFDLKKFITKEYDILTDSHEKYLDILLLRDDNEEFIKHYSKYQFILELEARKKIQTKFESKNNIINSNIIKFNLIPEICKSIKDIMINVLSQLLELSISEEKLKALHTYEESQNLNRSNDSNIKLNYTEIDFLEIEDMKKDNGEKDDKNGKKKLEIEEKIIKIFKNNKIYFNENFNYLIPTKFSDTYAYKFNKLLFDIAYFFFPFKDVLEKKNINGSIRAQIKEKLSLFVMLRSFIENINNINNDELIELCDYLFNCLKKIMQVDRIKRNFLILQSIINSCLPFDLDKAKIYIQIFKNSLNEKVYIDGINIFLFDTKDLKRNSRVKIITKYNKELYAEACDINWKDLNLLYVDDFMLCFRYKAIKSKNFLMDEPIKNNFLGLFNKMLKSNMIKTAMMRDSQAISFEYPFLNDDILNECYQSIHYVPLPAIGIYGFTDKNSFNIYIYSNFNAESLNSIFTEYDNILKTQCREFKLITRIYFHIFDPEISLKTPTINKLSKLISDNIDYMNQKISDINSSYRKRTVYNSQLDEYDYGDIFEIFLTGSKSTNFFLANSYFWLLESTWKITDIEKFDKEYRESIEKENITINKNVEICPFITSIMNYFNLNGNLIYHNDLVTKVTSKDNSKRANGDLIYINSYTYKETISHCKFPK